MPHASYLLRAILCSIAGAFCLVTISANAMFALGLGTSLPEKIVCVVMSVSADAFKCVAVLVCLRLWLQRRFVLAGVSCVLGLLCLGWSMLSAMGFALSVRDMTQAAHVQIADQYNGWTAVVRRAGEQLGSVQRHRPEQVIQAELAAQMVPAPIWKRTQACTELTLPESHTACARVLALRQELAAAQSAQALEERVDEARRHLATAPVVGLTADPQVAGLAAMLGTEEPTPAACSGAAARGSGRGGFCVRLCPRRCRHGKPATPTTRQAQPRARQQFPVAHPTALRLPGW